MYSFKVGDKVKCIVEPEDTHDGYPLLGKTGIVTEAPTEKAGPAVAWADWDAGWGDDDNEWYVENTDIALVS